MGYKKVCFNCQKAFSVYKNPQEAINSTCPECQGRTTMFNHKFRPPRKQDDKQWQLVKFLHNHGFIYQHIFKESESGGYTEVPYPTNMEEATEFVKIYKKQAYTDNNIF